MSEHSPTPWRIADGMNETIVDSLNRVQASAANADVAAHIVEAVNAVDATLKLQRTLLGWSMERDRLREERDTLNEAAASLQRSRDAALADAERLRDLVRRLASMAVGTWPYITDKGLALLREDREALGEHEP